MSIEKKIQFNKNQVKFLAGIDSAEGMQKWFNNHPDPIGFAMVGRSNVGKSSLINAFFGNKTARTSKTPGRTRQINIFEFQLTGHDQKFFLYDLPGYGYANVSKQMLKNWQELMDEFFHHLTNTTTLVNIQDARHPNQASDQKFHDYLFKGCKSNIVLVFNKMDKLKTQKERSKLNKLKMDIFKEYKHVKLIHFVSAETKKGLDILGDSLINDLLDSHNKINLAF